MGFDPSKPAANESPSVFPAQNQSNMSSIYDNFSADHQFNNAPVLGDNSGYHTLIREIPQNPSGSAFGIGRSYSKLIGSRIEKFFMNDAGNEYQITPTIPIRAAVNFGDVVDDNPGSPIIRSQFNVTSVTRLSIGKYRITFTNPMPDNNYIVSITGMRHLSTDRTNGQVVGDNVYGTNVTTTHVDIEFNGGTSTLHNVMMGNVIIMSIV